MRLMFAPALFAFLFATTVPALADDRINCAEQNTTVEINFCAEKDFKAADSRLNAAYKKVLAQIAERDLDGPYDRRSFEEAMRKSQRAWVAFRDAECRGVVPMDWSGGSGTTAAVLMCLTDMTTARTKDFVDRYNLE